MFSIVKKWLKIRGKTDPTPAVSGPDRIPSSHVKLIVGLGNPGSEYTKTRHNAGFMAVDRFASRHGLPEAKTKFHSAVCDGHAAGQRCTIVKPMTFMNRSGLAVGEAVRFYKLDPACDVLVVVDEVALPNGQIRIRLEGGTGGHNGLADVERALGTQTYARLRVGIGPRGRVPQADYVLGRFTPQQLDQLNPALDRACDAIECWLRDGVDQAMNRFNANPGE